jgi:hypothetical protein
MPPKNRDENEKTTRSFAASLRPIAGASAFEAQNDRNMNVARSGAALGLNCTAT